MKFRRFDFIAAVLDTAVAVVVVASIMGTVAGILWLWQQL